MSFDVNIGRSEPIIKAAAGMNNDGGSGGNTGYMGGGGRQKKQEGKGSLFSNNMSDSFELSTKLPEKDLDSVVGKSSYSWFNKLLKKIS